MTEETELVEHVDIVEAQGMVIAPPADSDSNDPAKKYSVRIIAPGWGSTGFYSDELLQESAPLFASGKPIYADHPSLTELRETGGVRSVNDQVGTLGSDAAWEHEGELGPGLYASLNVFESRRQWMHERRNSCGLSMHASGRRKRGKVGDRAGFIVTGLKEAHSVDVVTSPGAGGGFGQILENRGSKETEAMSTENKVSNITEAELENVAGQEAEATGKINREQAYSIFEYRQVEDERNNLKKEVLRFNLRQMVDTELRDHRILDITRRRLSGSLPDIILESDNCLRPVGNGDMDIDEDKIKALISENVELEKVYIEQVFTEQGGLVRGERIVESAQMSANGLESRTPPSPSATAMQHRPGSPEALAQMFESELGMPAEAARGSWGL